MSTVIDHSEKVDTLLVNAGDSLIIEKDAGSPKNAEYTRVSSHGISLGLGASVLIQDNGVLALKGVLTVNLLGTIDIGENGRLRFVGPLNAGVLSSVNFVGHSTQSVLYINTNSINLLAGNVSGFGMNDVIRLGHLMADSVTFKENILGTGGTLTFYDGATQTGQLGLSGSYTSANFAVTEHSYASGQYHTTLSYVPSGEDSAAASHPIEALSHHYWG